VFKGKTPDDVVLCLRVRRCVAFKGKAVLCLRVRRLTMRGIWKALLSRGMCVCVRERERER